ncbi:1-phosphofructokinase [Lacrimispora saccharolytica]|uniref:Tagatose-6-phosphate kinase n=1 Tax=Lacrimispora saccharolytica (strain ATCC 35040 / DSM 2544 / NRCC 2533 / WM1) TaxID=610130 RepID=D9R4D9_LACSW|nr:1-phosphofructokinase [Lacrimispora saccharolytica]ADL05009.1 1-phosphofructokinase [[Clostridium] saccharolyticum WM1]QRV20791.1 1-phosphofructokinase [Lacrimispora saccharolytica]
MIYTVTFNPALDYVIRVDHFALGAVNRTEQENIYYGGKGLNVSAVLWALGYENTALGFVAGFTGEEIERGVKGLGFQTDFIRVKKGLSRINVKLKSREETEINGMGPEIAGDDVKQLFEKLNHLTEGDMLVLSGSIPKSIDDNIYERIMESLDGRGVGIVVDATKDLLINVLPYHPFLIKPNNHELGEMFGVTLHSPEEIIDYGKRLQKKGARNVLISMAGDGAILITEAGEVFRMGVPKGTVKNSVGAGDSMVAGFIAGYLENGSFEHALRLGSAAGSASAFSEGLAGKEDIMKLYEELSKEGY